MPQGIFIPSDQETPLQQREFRTLEDYQQAVGGYIEAVDLPDAGATMLVNEEGLLRRLPFNPRATFLWWFWVPAARNKEMLVGDAVVVGTSDRRGDETDIPSELAACLLNPHGHRIEVLTHGDPKRYANTATYPDYFEAAVWGMSLLERWTLTDKVRIRPVDEWGAGNPTVAERPSRYHCAHSRTIEIGDVPATLIHTLLHGSPYEVELQMVAGQPWRGLPDVDESYTDAATWAVIQLE